MPRLTRTAKFADLRNQLLNDKEEYTKSNDLSSYENKLNNVKDNLVVGEEAKQNYWKNYQEPTYFQDPASEDPIYQELLKKEFGENPFKKSIEETVFVEPTVEEQATVIENPAVEIIEEQPEEIAEPIIEEATIEEPIIEEQVIEEVPFEESQLVEEPVEFEEVAVEEPTEIEEVAIDEEKIEEEPKVEQTTNDSYFDSFISNAGENFNSYFDDKTEDNVFFEDMFTNVFKDVKDESGEIVNLKERETYLNQTISDVNTYNEEIGEETINTAINNMIDEIRHPGRSVEEPIEEEQQDIDDSLDADSLLETDLSNDDEFNNTVSLEIAKIMDEVAGVSKDDYSFDEVEYEEPIEEEQLDTYDVTDNNQEINQIEEPQNEENTEDVVEIKNIAEIEKEEGNTISQTIPFIVADSEDLLDDEEDEEESNVVLNIILIVLIIVLVAVLGLIVFYILKTKGIL